MKKFLVTILAFVYLTATIGATVHLHYCMNKLVGWGFTNKTPENCGKCGMSKQGHTGCCHDEQKVFKVTKDHKLSETTFPFFNIKALQLQHIATNNTLYKPHSEALNPNSHAPPRAQVATYIFICIFRI